MAELTEEFRRVLDDEPFQIGSPIGPADRGAVLLGRDVTGSFGVVAMLRKSPKGCSLSWYVHARDPAGRWSRDPELSNGEPWLSDPDQPRPGDPGVTYASTATARVSRDDRDGLVVFAGVVGTPVATLIVESPIDRHKVRFDERTGAFVCVVRLDETMAMNLTGLDADGQSLDVLPFEMRV